MTWPVVSPSSDDELVHGASVSSSKFPFTIMPVSVSSGDGGMLLPVPEDCDESVPVGEPLSELVPVNAEELEVVDALEDWLVELPLFIDDGVFEVVELLLEVPVEP